MAFQKLQKLRVLKLEYFGFYILTQLRSLFVFKRQEIIKVSLTLIISCKRLN